MAKIGETHRKLDLPEPEREPGIESKFMTFDWSKPMTIRLLSPEPWMDKIHYTHFVRDPINFKDITAKPMCPICQEQEHARSSREGDAHLRRLEF